jgi:hypothetical protein
LVVVNCDLLFTYVLAGWEGSAHDATILVDGIDRDDGFTVPQGNCTRHNEIFYNSHGTHPHIRCLIVGKYYLVDARYACKPGFLPPFRGVRYHLSEYGSRNRPTNCGELYNLRHSSLRVTVERAIPCC